MKNPAFYGRVATRVNSRGLQPTVAYENFSRVATKRVLAILIALALIITLPAPAQSLLDSLPQSPEAPQETPYGSTFKSPHLIAAPTVESLPKGDISFRVAHRFGDMATPGTGHHTLFGLDEARDILLSLEYGLTDRTSLGIGRAKGNGLLGELWHGTIKHRLLVQKPDAKSMPISLTLYANAAYSTQKQDPFVSDRQLRNGPFFNRGSYIIQAQVARRFANRFSVQLSPTWLWRNYVPNVDANGLLSCGILTRLSLSKRFSLTTEYFARLASNRPTEQGSTIFWKSKGGQYYAPLSLGLELETGGHVFSISLSNTAGLLENDYLAYNQNNWFDGQFRMGFAIFRVF